MAKRSGWGHSICEAVALTWTCAAVAGFAAGQNFNTTTTAPAVVNRKEAAGMVLTQTRPEYPPLAKVNYIQGRVHIQVLVSPEGKVVEANVIDGHPFLAAAALNAVRKWVYRPLETATGKVAFVTLVDVNFALRITSPEKFPPDPEKDLSRQVHPPAVVDKPPTHAPVLHVRALIDKEGQVLDVNHVDGFPYHYDTALKFAERYKFQPARWGPLPVPWYLDVDVPAQDVDPQPAQVSDM